MEALRLQEFEDQAIEFDLLVAATPDIDHFCSATPWIVPAATALMPPRRPWLYRGMYGRVALMLSQHPQGWFYLEPLEAMWGLACPVVGPDTGRLAGELAGLCRRKESDWDMLVMSGVPRGSQLLSAITRHMLSRYELLQGQSTVRYIASLAGGLDGFLARRSRNFRKGLRRALRSAHAAGFEFETCHARDPESAAAAFRRVLDIEARSWKGQGGVGINTGRMYGFYRAMVPRLAARHSLRLIFARDPARKDNPDIAYVLGGTFGTVYRGLQFSFDRDYRHHALGNLCQYKQIEELCDLGFSHYDLGTAMEYKRRWAEMDHESVTLLVIKR